MAVLDRKTLINWSRGCLIVAIIGAIAGLLGKLPVFYVIAAVLLLVSVVLFYYARKKPEDP